MCEEIFINMKMTNMIYFGCILVSVLTVGAALEPGENCRTPTRQAGICKNLRECQPLFVLLDQERPLPPDTVKFLRDSQCGFQGRNPLVCCPSPVQQVTPPGTPGVTGVPRPKDITRHRNVRLINSEDCGRGSQERIFNGNKTGVFEYPWMALLAYRSSSGAQSFKCGGTLINRRYILTAAHCITNTARIKLVSVRVGEHDTSKDPDCEETYDGRTCAPSPQDIDVEEAIIHPLYSTKKFINDIALVRLKRNVQLNSDSVQPICLPAGMALQTKNHDGKKLIVAGWGATEQNLPASPDLLKVEVPVVPVAQCAAVYKASYKFDVNGNQLCAGGSNKAQDSCNGDSGGPLKGVALVGSEPRFVQFGVVSYGHRVCGTEGVPGVYTRVGHYMEWILDNMRP